MAGAFFGCILGCMMICVVLAFILDELNKIVKAINGHNPRISTESEFCVQPPEKDLNDSCLCDTVPCE